MKSLSDYMRVDESRSRGRRLRPKSKEDLADIIEERTRMEGFECDLNDIDVSKIDDMSYLFCDSIFEGDISQWDVSNVKDMTCMFFRSKFNGDVSTWNTGNVKRMDYMFMETPQEGMEPSWWRVDD